MNNNIRFSSVAISLLLSGLLTVTAPHADQVFNDELIVTSSACMGNDCVNGESFGFYTLKLKENNLRILFQDTSNSAAFPTTDWSLTANDAGNGGANKFSIEDIDASRTIFTLEASAPTNSFYITNSGNVGIGTSTPAMELQLTDGDTPTLRLNQDTSNGFNSQSWDIGGNEAGFFVRDVTNDSKLPLRIRSSAPTSSIDVSASGFVGINNGAATSRLDVIDTNTASVLDFSNTTGIRVTNSQSEQARSLLALSNNGDTSLILLDSSGDGDEWRIENSASNGFTLLRNEANMLSIADNANANFSGDIEASGSICANSGSDCVGSVASSRALKDLRGQVDTGSILNKVSSLNLALWNYKHDSSEILHLGPIAEEFAQAFGLNGTATDRIANVDASGVALASIQELHKQLKQKDEAINDLKRELAEIKAMLQQK